MEHFLETLVSLNPIWVYAVAMTVAYLENIFPPLPSDIVLVAAGYLCATGQVDFGLILILSTIGSATGFVTMYKIGSWFGLKVVETQKIKFLNLEQIHKVENWFTKYGYFVVIGNRFLAGTRAVISFFTGMANLSFWKTTTLAFLSSLMWNFILLYSGKAVGSNWRSLSPYLDTYGFVVILFTFIVFLLFIVRGYIKNRNKSRT